MVVECSGLTEKEIAATRDFLWLNGELDLTLEHDTSN